MAVLVFGEPSFLSIEDAQDKLQTWRVDYNEYRPHSSLDNMTPEAFARSMAVEANKPNWTSPQILTLKRRQ